MEQTFLLATRQGTIQEVTNLLEKGVPLTYTNDLRQNAAHMAVLGKNYDMVVFLHEKGVLMCTRDLNHQTPFDYALGIASNPEAMRIVIYLYENKLYIPEVMHQKSYVVDHLFAKNVVFSFVAQHFNVSGVNENGNTALHIAMTTSIGLFYLRRLLAEHPNIYVINSYGESPIDVGNEYTIPILKEYVRSIITSSE